MAPIAHVKNVAEFTALITGNAKVVVDYHAAWCGPCRNIAPKVAELAGSHADIVFAKVDVDEAEDVAQKQKISAMPTFQFFHNGKQVAEFKGASADKLTEQVNALKAL